MGRAARELWFVGSRAVELRVGVARELAADELRVRGRCSALSQGTELLLYRGEGPTPFDPSFDAPGQPTYPRRYGYAWVGEVSEIGRSVSSEWSTARVFGFFPHGDEHVVRTEQLVRLPAAVSDARATLLPHAETALTAVWDAGVVFRQRAVVLGGGVIGLLIARWLQLAGAERVTLIEPIERRRLAAHALGVEHVLHPEQSEAKADADLVFEASGQPALLDAAIAHAAMEASVIVVSFYGERHSELGLGAAFHRRRLTLRSSQVSTLPPLLAPRWTRQRRLQNVLSLLGDPALDALLEPARPFAEAAALYGEIDADPGARVAALFSYDP